MALIKRGSRGDQVKELQTKLGKLGYTIGTDGIYGDETEKAVINLQQLFGYTTDGIVGDGTQKLIDAQMGYGWNINLPDAKERALRSQGKG